MPRSFVPDRSQYSHVKDPTTKAEADKHIQFGWEFIEKHTKLNHLTGGSQTYISYRIGWPRNAGELAEPPHEGDLPKFDSGPSAN